MNRAQHNQPSERKNPGRGSRPATSRPRAKAAISSKARRRSHPMNPPPFNPLPGFLISEHLDFIRAEYGRLWGMADCLPTPTLEDLWEDPVPRAHIHALLMAGMSFTGIADAVGIPEGEFPYAP